MKSSFSSVFRTALTVSSVLILRACPSNTSPVNPPRHNTQITPPPKPQAVVALALGGGASKGFAHIGIIKVLKQNGIPVKIVTGTSAGAIVGSLYASGASPDRLELEAEILGSTDLVDLTLSTSGFIKGQKLQDYINRKVGNRPIQDFPIKFAAVATDFESSKAVAFNRGNAGQAVRASAAIPNIGPSVVYRIRDKAGQAVEYKNYMLPVKQEQDYFFITGTRTGLEQQYRWLRIPADKTFKPDTFMAMRELLKDEAARKAVIRNATLNAPDNIREQFTFAAENTLGIFAKGGYLALDEFITKNIPKEQQEKMQGYFYEMLFGVMNAVLEETIQKYKLPAWPQDEARNRFLLHSMDAYTGLTEYPAPMLLQLDGFEEVRSSGLQMTRSPGAFLVYLGSVLLVLGTIFMFYIREKRAWVLFSDDHIRFAMSSSRNERDLQKEFPQHTQSLQRLAKDLNHDA